MFNPDPIRSQRTLYTPRAGTSLVRLHYTFGTILVRVWNERAAIVLPLAVHSNHGQRYNIVPA